MKRVRRQDHEDRLSKTRPVVICETCKGIVRGWTKGGAVLSSRVLFPITKTREERGGKCGTYVDVALHITNENEVTSAGVADVGVNGDGTARVSLDTVG